MAQVLLVTSQAGFYSAPSILWWDIGQGSLSHRAAPSTWGEPYPQAPRPACTGPAVSQGCIHTGLAGSCKAHSLPGSESPQPSAPGTPVKPSSAPLCSLTVARSSLFSLAKGICAEYYPVGLTELSPTWRLALRAQQLAHTHYKGMAWPCTSAWRAAGDRALSSKATFHRTPSMGWGFGLEASIVTEADFGPSACRAN